MTSTVTPNRKLISWLPLLVQAGVAGSFILVAGSGGDGPNLSPVVAAITAAVWIAGTASRVLWQRWRHTDRPYGALHLDSLSFFLLMSSSAYAVMALRLVDFDPFPTPDRADSLPGLTTELRNYYLGVHAAVVLLIAWYGQTRGRALETAIAVQIVYTTVLYENMLSGAAGLPLLWGNVLVIATAWFARAGEEGLSGFRWSPIGPGVVALTGAAFITAITGAYM